MSQSLIATHSPILMGIPGAALYEIQDNGMQEVTFKGPRVATIILKICEAKCVIPFEVQQCRIGIVRRYHTLRVGNETC